MIIRLCSIECNFGAPLTVRPTALQQCFVAAPLLLDLCLHSQCFAGAKQDPSNQKFADDIRGWYNLTKRLYIWDYTTVSLHAQA